MFFACATIANNEFTYSVGAQVGLYIGILIFCGLFCAYCVSFLLTPYSLVVISFFAPTLPLSFSQLTHRRQSSRASKPLPWP